ncbi:hypothetical protein F4779DRAFT_625881 [Xylariaceae sp. FL0662B]|nr:hypothetical protein F4779DRAFT_625881 [Xylariaceae sp. FL0662B]
MAVDLDQHSKAILQVCSYHRRDFDFVLVRSRPHEMQVAQGSPQTAFRTPPASGLGILDRLPAELMSVVLHNLDLLSYFRFRQVNRRARVLSTALWEYQLVAKHGLEGLRGLLRAKIAHNFTIMDLYCPLITSSCMLCGAFGGFLFLLTVTRCCFACIQTSTKLRVLCTSTFAKLARMSTSRLHRLLESKLRTVPGIYSMEERPARRPKYLIAEKQAIATLTSLGVLHQDSVQAIARRSEQIQQRFMASTAFPWYDLGRATIERGVSCKGCQVRVETLYGDYEDRDRVFSTTDYLTHFTYCVEAQNLWAESQDGTRPVEEPEFTRRCGYFNKLGPDGLPI